jgi:prenylcysteine oxidase/farnesylcysteine lyase
MAIEGAMQIDGGNWQIFDRMLKASNATVVLNSTVNSISKHKGKYSIKTSTQDASTAEIYTNEEPFDTVVLAAPLQYSDIKIENDLLKRTPDKIPYVTLHVTLFASPWTLNPIFFDLAADAEVPTTILTTLPPDEGPLGPEDGVGSPGFFSISTLRPVINPKTLQKEYLYKIFSPRKVTSQFLSGILGSESMHFSLILTI